MSRRRKLVLLLVVTPILLVLLLIAALLTPAVQTFVARKALAGQGTVERVAVGSSGAELKGLALAQPGLKISVPAFKAELPLLGAAGGKIDIRSVVARDIVIDLDPAATTPTPSGPSSPGEPATPGAPFEGLLKAVQLPPDLKVNGIDLAGVLNVAGDEPMTLKFSLSGGGVEAGKAGRFEFTVSTRLAPALLARFASELPPGVTLGDAADVSATFVLLPTLDAAGQLSEFAMQLDALVKGGLFSKDTLLRTEARVARVASGESWSLRLISAGKTLAALDTTWAPGAAELPGKWTIDITDADLKPFVPLFALPSLTVAGAGDVAIVGAERAKLAGDFKFLADRLETLGLPELGPVAIATRFDLAGTAESAKVNTFKLEASSGGAPVALIEARQSFDYDFASVKLSSERPAQELLAINLLGVPASWIQLFVPGLTLGGPVTGSWSLRPEGDGVQLDTLAPLTLTSVSYGTLEQALLALDKVSLAGLRVRKTSSGLEAVVEKLGLVAGGKELAAIELRATQKPGAPLSARAEIRSQLAVLADQPALRGQTRLSAGQALLTLDATVAEKEQVGGQLRVTGLRADGQALPELTLDLDVARDAAGVLTARLPLVIGGTAVKRPSDLELNATATPKGEAWEVVAKLSSQILSLPDLQLFAAIASPSVPAAKPAPDAKPASTPEEPAAAGPLWAGVTGELELALARIVVMPGLETSANGRVALTKEALSLEKLQAIVSTGGSLAVDGALRWRETDNTYALAGEVTGRDVAVGPLLKALDPAASAPLEGTYAVQASLNGAGADPATAAAGAAADIRLTGKAGVLRALNLDTNRYAKLGASKEIGALIGLIGAAAGDSKAGRIAQQAAAANAFARKLGNLPYDELTLQASRAVDGSIELGAVRLRSPELNLQGSGSVGNLAGRSLSDQPLRLTLDLGAAGEIASQLGVLGLLKGERIEGYAPLLETITLDGTLRKVGTEQLNRLITRALGL